MVLQLINHSKTLFSRAHNSILSAALIIAASYAGSAGLGLVRNRLLAARFFGGGEHLLDAYFAAFVVPDTIFQLLVIGALSAAFIPVYSHKLGDGTAAANRLANATLTFLFLSMLVLTSGLFLIAPQIITFITHFPPDQIDIAAGLMRLMLVSQLFFTISSFTTGIIQSHRRFLVPALAPLAYNFGQVLGIVFLVPYFGIYGAALGVIIGSVLHLLVQLPLLLHLGFRFKPLWEPNQPGVTEIRHLMLPRTAALGINQIERWVAVHIASSFISGSLTMYNFARQLYLLPVSLFGISLGQASFPVLASDSDKDRPRFTETLTTTLMQLFFFAIPASALILVLRIPLVRIVFGAKAFPWPATIATGRILAIFALSIAPQAATQILIRAFYALKNTRTPLLVSVITVSISVSLSYIFTYIFSFGILGMATAISLTSTLEMFVLAYLLTRHLTKAPFTRDIFSMIFATLVSGLTLWTLMHLLEQFIFDTTRTLPLVTLTVIASILGLVIYLIICKLLNVPAVTEIEKILKKFSFWRAVGPTEVIDPAPQE